MIRRSGVTCALVLAAAPALAQDLFLEVPVRVANVHPSASLGSVTCTAFADPTGASSSLGYLGSGTKWFALANGAFAGKVPVAVRFDTGRGPARSYRCALYLISRQGDKTMTGAVHRLSDRAAPEYREAFRAAPGAALVHEVTGTL